MIDTIGISECTGSFKGFGLCESFEETFSGEISIKCITAGQTRWKGPSDLLWWTGLMRFVLLVVRVVRLSSMKAETWLKFTISGFLCLVVKLLLLVGFGFVLYSIAIEKCSISSEWRPCFTCAAASETEWMVLVWYVSHFWNVRQRTCWIGFELSTA